MAEPVTGAPSIHGVSLGHALCPFGHALTCSDRLGRPELHLVRSSPNAWASERTSPERASATPATEGGQQQPSPAAPMLRATHLAPSLP
jgi:hypothetical protein